MAPANQNTKIIRVFVGRPTAKSFCVLYYLGDNVELLITTILKKYIKKIPLFSGKKTLNIFSSILSHVKSFYYFLTCHCAN